MARSKFSLRSRVFFSMILLVVMTSLLILGATFYQYYSQSDDYNLRRLERKETQVKNHLSYILDREDAFNLIGEKQASFYNIFESIGLIHKVEYALFSMEGVPYFYSYVKIENMDQDQQLDPKITEQLLLSERQRIAVQNEQERGRFQSSYSVLFDTKNKPYGILYFPYFEDVSFSTTELNTFLMRLFQIYFFMLLVAIIIAYFISSYMTRPLETIRARIDRTGLLKGNEKIYISNASKEVDSLVNSYNSMLDALEESIAKLARSEREQAWQEMAKQVAHEIKNPLTPMKLSVQSFERDFRNDKKNKDKVEDFSQTIIQQIDTMSSIASAFSNFAEMPTQQGEKLNIVKAVRLSLEIFKEKHIVFKSNEDKIIINIDRPQIVRIMTNLIKNAVQACENTNSPSIKVSIKKMSKTVSISVRDNGNGIPLNIRKNIFEPNFTTKSGGMGLGLGMVKNLVNSYEGKIDFESKVNKGTTFKITFPTLD